MDTPTPPLEGSIRVDLRLDDGRVAAVDLTSSRPRAARLLRGRPMDQAVTLLPTLFSLCGTAQAVAGLSACERARGRTVPADTRRARALVVLAEAAEQNALRLYLDWPRLLGLEPDLARLRRLRAVLADIPAACGDGWRRPGGGTDLDLPRLTAALGRLDGVLGGQGGPLPSRCRQAVEDAGLAAFGAGDVAPLEPLPLDWYDRRLGAGDGADFAAAPDVDGAPRETGPLARLWDAPPVAAARGRWGTGLGPRMIARGLDLAGAPDHLRAALDAPPEAAPGPPVGVVETARGTLVHRVALDGDAVAAYQILAPTEWNFHPRGALARGLAGAAVGGGKDAKNKVALLTSVIDPCVDFEVFLHA